MAVAERHDGLYLLDHSERCGDFFKLREDAVLQDLLRKLLRNNILAAEDKACSYR